MRKPVTWLTPKPCMSLRNCLRPRCSKPATAGSDTLQLAGHFAQAPSLQMMQHDRFALGFRQLDRASAMRSRSSLRDAMRLGRRLIGGQPMGQPRRRFFDSRLQRLLASHVALIPAKGSQGVAQVIRQRPSQPGRQGFVVALELVLLDVGLQQRLLHDIRRVEFALCPAVELQPGQEKQVRPIAVERQIEVFEPACS